MPDDGDAAELADSLAQVGNERFLEAVTGSRLRFHHRSSDVLLGPAVREEPGPDPYPVPEPTWSLLLRAAHLSFAAHLPLSLSPDVLWYAVVHEVAVHVRLNTDRYVGLFTDTPAHREEIRVRDDSLIGPNPDWCRSLRLVRAPLEEALGADVAGLFLPRFSTTTPADASSALVALMSVVSPYYRFTWESLCGIPRIRLEGEAEDWRTLADRVRELEDWFEGLAPWFDALRPVLGRIADTAAGGPVDTDFWRSFYKWESESGGEYVSGWITAFFAHVRTSDGPRPKESPRWDRNPDRKRKRNGGAGPVRFRENAFPSHVSEVPFRWETPDGVRGMRFLAGVLGIERDGDYVRPRLGHAVAEVLPAVPHPEDGLLPDGWTHARLRQVSGCPGARALSPEREVRTTSPGGGTQRLDADCVIDIAGLCLVRSAADATWYKGDLIPDSGEVVCWGERGTTYLLEAVRGL